MQDATNELRSFKLSLTRNAGTARGQGRGSFVNSVLEAIDKFYMDVVQRIKPWTASPPAAKSSPAEAEGDETAGTSDTLQSIPRGPRLVMNPRVLPGVAR